MRDIAVACLVSALAATSVSGQVRVTLVGNAGVMLSDGRTSILVDLPYESGAFGYMTYDPAQLAPDTAAVAVITHHHRDHFAAEIFRSKSGWRLIGPPSVTQGVSPDRVLVGDSVRVGAFSVIAVPTPHTVDHRSYRVRWFETVFHFVGDTEDATSLESGPEVDVLFVTPWLSCAARERARFRSADRRVAYHLAPNGQDRVCGGVEILPQGSSFEVPGGPGAASPDRQVRLSR